MRKIAVYESWKDNRKFTSSEIKKIYGIEDNFNYYCDSIKSRVSIQNRKELDRLKDDINNNKISVVLVRSINHLSRDMQAVSSFMDFARDNDCDVIDINGFNHTNFYKFHKDAIEQTIKENQVKSNNAKENEGVSL